MENTVILIGVLAGLLLVSKLLPQKKKPGGSCARCPEYRTCGGGRPRCVRRSKSI